jgi:16S rRNA C1402 N4-methylase RsmH
MALRRFVNDEQGELERLLAIGPELLSSTGRMVVVSFMSLEDRQVKERFRSLALEGRAVILTRRPLVPDRRGNSFESGVAERQVARPADAMTWMR